MAFNPFTVIKSLLIKQEDTSTPTQVEIIPGGTASTKTTIQAAQTTNKTLTLPDATDTLIGKATTDVLTNKSIDADGTGNVITNIDNGNIKAAAAIDATKIADGSVSNTEFQLLNGLSSGIVTLDGVQTLTNKTLTAPVVNSPTGIVKADVGLSNVDNTSDATKNAAVATLTNKTLTSPVINSPTGLVKADVGLSNVDNTSDATKTPAAVTLQNKIIDNTNVITVTDTGLTIQDSGDVTKQLQLDAGSITPGALRVLTAPNANTTIVGTDVAQVLTLKDIDGGTASNTSRVTLPKAARTTLDALTRKQGTIVHDTTTNKPLFDDGTNLQAFGTGAGNINFITNSDAESGTTGWATYSNAAGRLPVTGAGGSPNVTFTTTSTTPLNGLNSFLFTKDAANRQGQGASSDFTIPLEFRAKALTVKVPYIVNSGTFVAGTSSTDSDVILYFYDITNSKLVEPSSIKMLSNSSSVSDAVQATVQFDSNCTSARLILHCATTSTSAYVLKLDDISVGPANYQYGTPITDWQPYTPTFTGMGVVTNLEAFWRRVGDSVELDVKATSGTTTATEVRATLPNGLVSKTWVQGNKIVGNIARGITTTNHGGFVIAQSATGYVVFSDSATFGSASINALNSTTGIVGSSEPFSLFAKVPIAGWSSSVQTSDQTDTRVVSASLSGSSTSVTSSGVTIVPTSALVDTHGGFSGSTYTIPVAGYYMISASRQTGTVAWTSGDAVQMGYKKNAGALTGNSFLRPTTATTSYYISFTAPPAYFNTGDAITFFATDDRTNTTAGFTASITRISGPSAIAANETVAARYTNTAGTSIANSGDIAVPFATKDYDTHGAFVTDTFTCPISGKYSINSSIIFSASTYAISNSVSGYLYKNGSKHTLGSYYELTAAVGPGITAYLNTVVNCNAGDTLVFRVGNTRTAGATTLITNAGYNVISITRVGN